MKRTHRLVYLLMRAWWKVWRPVTVGARVLLVRDGQVLLLRHTYLHHWYALGGGVERGETPEQAVRREAAEEVGATLGEVRLLGIYTNFKGARATT